MVNFTMDRKDVAPFVSDILASSEIDSRSITIIHPERSEDCCVSIAIATLSDDIVETLGQVYFRMLMRI
jgi:hypothetical protein